MTISGLRLTSPTAELAEQFLTWRHRTDVTHWFMQQRIEDTEEYVADWAAYDDHDHHRVVAVLDGAMVGQATLGVVDGMGQSGSEAQFVGREGRLSYFVHPDHAGRGIATALARDALANAFGRLRLRRVQAGCFADNIASWRVMEKLGMRREQHGVKDSFHTELGWVDGYTYALLAEEWSEGAHVPHAGHDVALRALGGLQMLARAAASALALRWLGGHTSSAQRPARADSGKAVATQGLRGAKQ